ncbi:MAG TPA: phytase [Planctomycetaceae bacterium]|jgi:3-phytase
MIPPRPDCSCSARSRNGWAALASVVWLIISPGSVSADDAGSFSPVVQLANPESKDQDDACVWVHPERPVESTVIASDKSAGRLFVYDLEGRVLQSLSAAKPGNIDIRQNVKIDGRISDIVVVNQRTQGYKLLVYRIDRQTRKLERLDEGHCATDPNYGGCLYHSGKTQRLYFICTSETGAVEQLELAGNGNGGVQVKKVRNLMIGKCEGAVADDHAGSLFIAEEKNGVWKFDAEPDAPATGSLVAKVGEHGLKGDVEGLALWRRDGDAGAVLVSDQGRNRVLAYGRAAPHEFIGEFAIAGAVQTDGIELCQANLGPRFPGGVFVCHTDRAPRPLLLTPWPQIAAYLTKDGVATPR